MILTCPECATGYFVQDGQIGPGGRTVRCAACGARWTAYADAPLDLVPPDQDATADSGAGGAPPEDAPAAADDLPRAFRGRAEEEKRLKRATTAGVAWAGAAVAVAALLAGAVLMRESVVRAWPRTASAYAAIGLPVNPTGLVIEQVRAEPSLQNGHAVLAVSGVIRNVEDRPVVAPPLRISLTDPQGRRVAGQIATLGNALIPPGQIRHFVTSIVDPPFSAANLQVDFALGVKSGAATTNALAAPAAAVDAQAASLRGPAEPVPQFSSNAASPGQTATNSAPASNAATSSP